MTPRRSLLAVALLLAAGCTGDDEATVPGIDTTAKEPATTSPAPGGATATWCDAVAAAPMRWLDDAIVPLQLWVDSFSTVGDAPGELSDELDRLVAFGAARLRWHLTGDGERPMPTPEVAADRLTIVEAALTTCPGLPLAFGPDASRSPAWSSTSPEDLARRCADDLARLEAAIDEHRATTRSEPRHQAEMEEVVVGFFASDVHGIVVADGVAVVTPVPDGACDLP